MRGLTQRWLLIATLAAVIIPFSAACEDERCAQHSECEPPELCVEQRCWVSLCSTENPSCPDDSYCQNGWCHAGESDADITDDAAPDSDR